MLHGRTCAGAGTRRQGLAAPPSRRRSPHCSNLHSDHLNQGFSGRGHIAKFNFRNTSATAASRRSRPWSSSLPRYGLVTVPVFREELAAEEILSLSEAGPRI